MTTYNLKLVKTYLSIAQNSDEFNKDIENIYDELKNKLLFKNVYSIVELEKIDSITKESKDVRTLLETSEKAILLVCTLGMNIEEYFRKLSITDKYKLMLADAVTSTIVENYQKEILNEIHRDYKEYYFTDSFGIGYGDLNIKYQKDIFELLNATKRVGVTLTEDYLMIPRKSISCIVGISKKKQPKITGCKTCNLFKQCNLRKKGETCAN